MCIRDSIRNYYDNYAFRAQAGFNNSNFPDDASGNGKGALPASVATVLGSSNKIYTAHYYDIKGLQRYGQLSSTAYGMIDNLTLTLLSLIHILRGIVLSDIS